MENISDRLRDLLGSPDMILVFPTEVSARSWSEHLLLAGDLQALREDRIISWDRCKQLLFPRHDQREPANSIHRMLFTQQLLKLNSTQQLLSFLVPKAFSSESRRYSSLILRLLGLLDTLSSISPDSFDSRDLQDFISDAHLLYHHYLRFLDECGLFEPSFLPPQSAAETDVRFGLCFFEAYSDIEEYRPLLERTPAAQFLEMPEAAVPELMVFENQHQEILGCMEKVEQLAASGMRAEDMVITACDYDGMYEDLRLQARMRGLPLRFKSGRPLVSYPAARLFNDIQQVISDDFSLDSMKRLLLCPAYRWTDPQSNRRLIQFGVESSCLRNTRDQDIWAQRLSRSGDQKLLSYYTMLRGQLNKLVRAADIQSLYTQLQIVQKQILRPYEDETSEHSRVFSFCIQQLEKLRRAEASYEGLVCDQPYGTWLSILEKTWYVPQQEQGGISVYPYGVSAGIYPKVHLVIGADSEHTAFSNIPVLPISEEHQQRLGMKPADRSTELIRTYAGSGETIHFSCSRQTRNSVVLPASLFTELEKVREPTYPVYSNDLYLRELDAWTGNTDGRGSGWYPLQLVGFKAAEITTLSPGGFDATEKGAGEDHPGARFAWEKVTRKNGYLSISPTSLDQFATCPFTFFIRYVLGINKRDFIPDMMQSRTIGNLVHRCYEKLFRHIQAEGSGRFDSGSIGEYRQVLSDIMDQQLKRLSHKARRPAEAVFPLVEQFVREHLVYLLEEEAKLFDGWEVAALEAEVSVIDEQQNIELNGRIDRISRDVRQARAAVIDYKKKNRHTIKSFTKDSAEPDSYQLPIYAYLVEQSMPQTGSITDALYYDVSGKKYVSILPGKKNEVDRQRFDELIRQALEIVHGAADAVRNLDVDRASSPGSACPSCEFRDVCRGRFSIR